MPCLDAEALESDPLGLAFLRCVLGLPRQQPSLRRASPTKIAEGHTTVIAELDAASFEAALHAFEVDQGTQPDLGPLDAVGLNTATNLHR